MANLHLEGSPYRPNDRVSQLKSALQRLQLHLGSNEAAEARARGGRVLPSAVMQALLLPRIVSVAARAQLTSKSVLARLCHCAGG